MKVLFQMKHRQVGGRLLPDGRVLLLALTDEEDAASKAHIIERKSAAAFKLTEKRNLNKVNLLEDINDINFSDSSSLTVGSESQSESQPGTAPVDFTDISDLLDCSDDFSVAEGTHDKVTITLNEAVSIIDRNTAQTDGFYGDVGSSNIKNKGKSGGKGRGKGRKRKTNDFSQDGAAKKLHFMSPQLDPRIVAPAIIPQGPSPSPASVAPVTPAKDTAAANVSVPLPPVKVAPELAITSLPPVLAPDAVLAAPLIATASAESTSFSSVSSPSTLGQLGSNQQQTEKMGEESPPVEQKKEEGAAELAQIELEYAQNLAHLMNLHKQKFKIIQDASVSRPLLRANVDYLNQRAIRDLHSASGRVEVVELDDDDENGSDVQAGTASYWKPVNVLVRDSAYRPRTALVLASPEPYSCKAELISENDDGIE